MACIASSFGSSLQTQTYRRGRLTRPRASIVSARSMRAASMICDAASFEEIKSIESLFGTADGIFFVRHLATGRDGAIDATSLLGCLPRSGLRSLYCRAKCDGLLVCVGAADVTTIDTARRRHGSVARRRAVGSYDYLALRALGRVRACLRTMDRCAGVALWPGGAILARRPGW